jgi:hypothetical protein
MKTALKQTTTGRTSGLRTALLVAGMGIAAALSAGPAFSSGSHGDDSYERHDSGRCESKLYGTVEKIPSGRVGIWTVNGREITVTGETRIKEEHGRAIAGVYVEVEGNNSGKSFSAHMIEVKRAKR